MPILSFAEESEMAGPKKKRCGQCQKCLLAKAGKWKMKCSNIPQTSQTNSTIVCTPPKEKRAALANANALLPKTKSIPSKANNQKGFWARKKSLATPTPRKRKSVPEDNLESKAMQISSPSSPKNTKKQKTVENLTVFSSPKTETEKKRQIVDTFEYFGISKCLTERLKSNMFFQSSPSKLCKGRKSELVRVRFADLDFMKFKQLIAHLMS